MFETSEVGSVVRIINLAVLCRMLLLPVSMRAPSDIARRMTFSGTALTLRHDLKALRNPAGSASRLPRTIKSEAGLRLSLLN
jgi:hypothetical protein